jgi:hypothetical protein
MADDDMRQLTFIMAFLLMISLTLCSEPIAKLGGIQGNSLLRNLTNNSTNNTTDLAVSGNLINLSQMGGDEGTMIFENLAGNSSLNGTANSTNSGLSSWGSRPPRKAPPGPNMSNYDPKRAEMIAIIKANHGF